MSVGDCLNHYLVWERTSLPWITLFPRQRVLTCVRVENQAEHKQVTVHVFSFSALGRGVDFPTVMNCNPES